MSEWDNLIADLTREHPATVHTDNGDKYTTVDGLLEQLRDEMFGGTNRGGAASARARLPFNAGAVDLYQLIDRQVSEVWGAAFKSVPGGERTEALLTQWAALVGRSRIVSVSSPRKIDGLVEWVPESMLSYELASLWKSKIENLFDPPRTAEIKAACIQCGATESFRMVDGERQKTTALVFIRDRATGESTEARCLECGASWLPDQYLYLVRMIAASETPKSLTQTISEKLSLSS